MKTVFGKIGQRIAVCVCVIAALSLAACDSFYKLGSENGFTAQGAAYEVVVVSNSHVWDSAAGEELRSVLQQEIPAFNQSEPMWTVMRVLPDGFKNIIAKHRNVIKLLVDDSVEPAIGVQYDVSSHPQTVMVIQAPTEEELAQYIEENKDNILYVLEKSERDRTLEYANKYYEGSLRTIIYEKFGVDMRVPKGYMLRSQSDDFVWISYEHKLASQGFFIYSYPYKGPQSLQPAALVAARNKFASRIPGPSDGSYMITYDEFEPLTRAMRINGRLWVEMRGLWDVQNDFMGGPFVSYTTVDTETNRVITLDCYVYSPQLPKRNYMRPLEHLVYLMEFPDPDISVSASAVEIEAE